MKTPRKKIMSLMLLGLAGGLLAGYAVKRALPPAAPPSPAMTVAAPQAQPVPAQNKAPLSSLAPAAKPVTVFAAEGPSKRLAKLQLDPPPQQEVHGVLPDVGIDPKHPPQWTKPLALAPKQVTPPNPFVEPPLAVDPERQPPAAGPRYSAGVFKEVP